MRLSLLCLYGENMKNNNLPDQNGMYPCLDPESILGDHEDGFIISNRMNQIVWINKQAEKILGAGEDIIGQDVRSLVLNLVGSGTGQAKATRMTLSSAWSKRQDIKDIEFIPDIIRTGMVRYQSSIIPIGDLAGGRVTRLKAIEPLMRQPADRQPVIEFEDALIENPLEGVVILDFEGNVLFTNRRMCEIVGLKDPSDIIGASVYRFVNHAYHDAIRTDQHQVLEGRGGYLNTYHVQRSDGTDLTIEGVGTLISYQGEKANLVFIRDITGRKEIEEAFRESEERFKSLVLSSSDIIAIITSDAIIRYVSPSVTRILGYTPEEVQGEELLKYVHPDDLISIEKDFNRLKNIKGISRSARYRLQRSDGSYVWAEGTINNLLDDPAIGGFVVNARDVTNEHLTRQALRHRIALEKIISTISSRFISIGPEDFDRALNQTLMDIGEFSRVDRSYIFQIGQGGGTISNSHEWCATGVVPQHENLQMLPIDLFPWWMSQLEGGDTIYVPRVEELPPEASNEKSILDEQEIKSVLVVPLSHSSGVFGFLGFDAVKGEKLWSPDDIRLLKLAGQIIASAITNSQATELIRASVERFRNLTEMLPLPVFETDTGHRITFANRSAVEIFGYTSEEFADMPNAACLVETEERERFREGYQILCNEGHLAGLEYHGLRKDGSTFVFMFFSNAIAGDGGTIGMRAVLLDITEIKQYQEALKEANKKLNLLSSITRHDILNQVTGLSGYTELLEELVPGDPTVKNYLDRIRELTSTIQRQITFTRDYQDMGVRKPEWQNIKIVASAAAVQVLPPEINATIAADDIEIFADPMLEKVFYNLFENAVRHGGGITCIDVSFKETGEGEGIISVADNGKGIPDKLKLKIFSRGFGSHTGYGLFLVREILEITGISIGEAGTEGNGACFDIGIPRTRWRKVKDQTSR